MKFKVIFGLFNALIIISFVLVAFLPAFIVGTEYAYLFWSNNWPIVLLFLLVLGGLNSYFVVQWPLFTKLEAQDWNGLSRFLEHRIYDKSRVSTQNARILVNTYVVLATPDRITKLEQFLRGHKERIVRRLALELGIAHLLSGDPERIVRYFDEMRASASGRTKEWCDWNYAFGLFLKQRNAEAREVLVELVRRTTEPLIKVVALFVLSRAADGDERVEELLIEECANLRKRFDHAQWQKYLAKFRGELQVLAISKIIEDAQQWLFEESERHDSDMHEEAEQTNK